MVFICVYQFNAEASYAHPYNQDTFSVPKGFHIIGIPVYICTYASAQILNDVCKKWWPWLIQLFECFCVSYFPSSCSSVDLWHRHLVSTLLLILVYPRLLMDTQDQQRASSSGFCGVCLCSMPLRKDGVFRVHRPVDSHGPASEEHTFSHVTLPVLCCPWSISTQQCRQTPPTYLSVAMSKTTEETTTSNMQSCSEQVGEM